MRSEIYAIRDQGLIVANNGLRAYLASYYNGGCPVYSVLPTMANKFDMVVVGTGWHGLAAAKVYIELHPTENLLVLEAENSCGGTWSHDRLYPGLKSNNLLGTYEYPDFPMLTEVYGVKPGEHIPGPTLHRYLTDFAKKFGVYSRIQFSTKVESLQSSTGGGWIISTSPKSQRGEQRIETRKVIIATGLTSQPNFPSYLGSETFDAPYFHAKDFCRNGETVKTAKNAVVVGGAKSAYDVAYAYSENGVNVDLVVRPNGNGPVWISYPWVMGGKKRLEQLLAVRWMTWFSPCPFGGVDGWQWVRNFLHGTAAGRLLVRKFWGGLESDVIDSNGYKSHPELQKLQPWNSAFWTGSSLSIHNYSEDFFKMVKDGRIRVHVADIDRLTPHTVHLSSGEPLKADVLVCATGWRKEPSIQFKLDASGIGLPQAPTEQAQLATDADDKLLKMYPSLKGQPTLNFKPKGDPLRLYRFIVPPARMADRNIAFSGMVSSVSTASVASVQALWISAYLDGKLANEAKTLNEITDEVMTNTQWGKWRYPCGYGATLPDMVFDALPYIGTLLKDLGLKVNRKSGVIADLTVPYGPRDFTGIVNEWVEGVAKA